MQIVARTAVYDTDRGPIGRIVLLAEAEDHRQALIIEFRVIDTPLSKFPELQGAVIRLDVPDGELPKVEKDGQLVCYFGGEVAQYDENNAAQHYVSLCQESGAEKPGS